MNFRKALNSNIAYILYFALFSVIVKVAIKMISHAHGTGVAITMALLLVAACLAVGAGYLLYKHRIYLWKRFSGLSIIQRMLIWVAISWITLVLSIVLVFSPFGSYMYGDDWVTTLKIVIFPPILFALGYLSYSKMVKR
jgi:hypothetical protein